MKMFYGFAISVLLVVSIVFFFKGHDKLTNYNNPDSDYGTGEAVNAEVGGDAYNYIINSERATGFFVLGGVFLISAIGLGGVYQISRLREEKTTTKLEQVTTETLSN
ncbi:hypothetical protein [Gottfriedia acidiceleris]|uniref:hypothetical protein n=1 Tax=Gottfriedia acidiceleris TaxID=371036 RepID=UPI0030002506